MAHAQAHFPAHESLDGKRIAANSLVIIVHALALAVLLLPSSWSPPKKVIEQVTVIDDYVPPKDIPIPPPPPLPPIQPVLQPTATPTITTQVAVTQPVDTSPVVESGDTFGEPTEVGPVVDTFEVGPPQVETLAYDVYPAPKYPARAARGGLTGTVLLRVLVDETGQPTSVEIETSSGHRILDLAARAQVLERWRFHPAQRQGRKVSAYALVPVAFNLPR